MIDLAPTPSSLLKIWAGLARWALGLVAAAWLVFGLAWGALHGWIVPRIDEFRPQLEAQASAVLGVKVRIGGITAQSTGLIPSFELTEVQLFDAQNRLALRLSRVVAALSPGSVARLGFEQLLVVQPELDIRRDPSGKIWVAGLDLSGPGDADSGAADWFFSQIEFAIQGGTVRWTDELRGLPTLALDQVDLVVRNPGRRHAVRLDATPPAQWGERFTVMGQFVQPLLALRNDQWHDWQGQLYAMFNRVDVSELRRYADVGMDVQQGQGAVRAWADVSRGQVTAATADVALAAVSVTLGPTLQPLALQLVRGRLAGLVRPNGFEFSTQNLAFDTAEGLRWSGGNVSLAYTNAAANLPPRGEFKADQMDLATLSQIADRLPLDPVTRSALQSYAPQGLVQRVKASWQGPPQAVSEYDVKGEVTALAIAPVGDAPGVRGADLEFDFNQGGGRASITVKNGAVALPTFFADPVIAVNQLSSEVRWQIKGEHIAAQLPNLKFANDDTQGEAQIKWETSDPTKSNARSRFPGQLDLQANLSRADGTRVHRYLPTGIDAPVREYLRDALQAGTTSNVKFKVKGDLYDVPFADSTQGEFRIAADVQNATFAYVPRSVQDSDTLPWPALTQLNGQLVIDKASLAVTGARARMGATSGLQISQVDARIADLNNATVQVNAVARGPLSEVLGIVNGSPVGPMIDKVLNQAVVSGSADYKLQLTLPIETIDQTKVKGSVTLAGNDVQISPDSPKLGRARGVVNFSEQGFAIVGGQARVLGGDARLEGGSVIGAKRPAPTVVVRASGTASAEGLRQASELGFVARLARQASGGAAYTAVLGFGDGPPEIAVNSNLQGLALNLPAPLNKSAEALLPLKLDMALVKGSLAPGVNGQVRLRDRLTLNLGQVANLVYVRDLSGPEPRVLRGSIGVGLAGDETAPLPESGVVANINLNRVDLDAWGDVLSAASGTSLASVASAVTPANGGATPLASAQLSYLPTSLAVRAQALVVGGRTLNQVIVGGSREGLLWRANLDANELNGYVEYRQPSGAAGSGRVFARLARLTLAPSAVSEVESLLDDQPTSIPALDIVVDSFELRGKRLGRVEIEAVNRIAGGGERDGSAREWRLNKFNVSTPEAVLTATGNWASLNAPSSLGSRRTVMNFKLDIANAGDLLSRLGMKDVIRRGRGKMEGQVAWLGSPITLDYPSMNGAFTVNVETGQFLKADPGIAKLLGVLSLQSLPRRLALDFRDVFSEGFAFDFLRGDVNIAQGIARTNNLQMKGVNAAVLMEGQADIAQETQDLKVVVVPEINAGTASLIATVINPAVGLGTFLAQFFLRRPLIEAATQEFHIDGAWDDPKITKVARKSAVSKE